MMTNLDMAALIWRSALPKGCNKLVLQCFVHHLNTNTEKPYGYGLSWPGISRVALMCGMSERTVQLHVRALQAAGILRLRHRIGRKMFYSVHLDALVQLPLIPETVVFDDAGQPVDNSAICASAVDNPTQQPAVFAENLQENDTEPAKNDTKSVEIFTQTIKEPITEQPRTAAPALPATVMMVDGVNPQVLADFAAIRVKKRKGAVTGTLLETICEQAALARLTLEQALKACVFKGWATFEASWVTDAIRAVVAPASAAPAAAPAPASPPPEPPEPVKLAAPEVRAAALAAYRAKQAPSPALPAMPAGASEIRIAPGAPSWAVGIVHKAQSGQFVSNGVLRDACLALKLDPALLRRAAPSPAAARMH